MTEYNATMGRLLDAGRMPSRMQQLPIMEGGWPQLFFASITQEGKPDLRRADPRKWISCVKHNLCWLCGQPMGVWKGAVLGPMCCITRTSNEPPCHRECAEFAAIACPFLTKPKMKRNEAGLPEGYHAEPPGIMLTRNPGCIALWVCKNYTVFRDEAHDGYLIRVGEPQEVLWYAEGREATRNEVLHSISTGLPVLQKLAVEEGIGAVVDLAHRVDNLKRWLPSQ